MEFDRIQQFDNKQNLQVSVVDIYWDIY